MRPPRLSGMDWLFAGLFLLFALPAIGVGVWKLVGWLVP